MFWRRRAPVSGNAHEGRLAIGAEFGLGPQSRATRFAAHFDWCAARQQALVACLQSHDLAVQPAGVDLLPRSARLFIQAGRGVKIATVEAREREIRAALGDRRAYVAQDRRGRVYVEIPLPARLARDIAFAGLLLRARRQLEAQDSVAGQRLAALPFLLGIDETGRLLLGDLASEVTPHMLVAGTTGSGKTVLLSSIVLSLAALNAQRDLQVALIDGKAFNLARFSRLPHLLAPPATDPDAWPAAVGHVVGEMERRLSASHPITHPHVVLVVDELANVLERWHGLEPELVRLAREGREVGIHGIFATQRPTAAVISGSVLANLPCRLVGMCVSGQEASLATGQPQSGAQHLPGRGSFVAVADGGSLTRFQAALVTDDDIREGLIALQQTRREQVPPLSAGTTNVISFVERIKRHATPSGPGRPAASYPDNVIPAILAYHDEVGEWPSRRWVARQIGESEGTKRASDARARAALDDARAIAQAEEVAMNT